MTVTLAIFDSSLGYELLFGLAALAAVGAATRAWQVEDPELRRSLLALLLASGGWSASHVGMFLLPAPYNEFSYLFGLILGFGTVWAWLYFASAYTGRTYHREPTFRLLAGAIYLGVVAVKVTNPLHHLYFETAFVTDPFPHLTIQQGVFHWAVTGFSYALAAAGIFMLLDLFVSSDYDTWPLAVLAGLTGLPVTLDIVGYATPLLVDIIYAPIGVGAFAIGVLFLFRDRFLAVKATGDVSDPLVFLDDDGRIRDYNDPAGDLFPALSVGLALDEVVPGATNAAENDQLLELDVEGERRYFVVSNSVFEVGQNRVGEVVLFSDVTESEQRRRELARHNRQLEDFAGAMTHELRNSLQVIDWNVQAAAETVNVDFDRRDPLETATGAAGRMADLVDDFTVLARHGQTVEELTGVDLREVVADARRDADTEVSVTVADDATVEAESRRLRALFASAFEFADRNGATEVTVEVTRDGFAIADDGDPPLDPVDKYFAYDEAVPDAKAGMKLPNVRSLASVHGWEVAIDAGYRDGVRVVVSGVRLL
ncbi:MAG: histidine kinase N-terminal 7TM domain-containing protein [Haloarculaceae archaeon]